MATTVFIVSGTTFTVPGDFSGTAQIDCIGAGSGGAFGDGAANFSSGGAGGAWARGGAISGLNPGDILPCQIGVGSNGASSIGSAVSAGTDTWIAPVGGNATNSYVLAKGGGALAAGGATGGVGGAASACRGGATGSTLNPGTTYSRSGGNGGTDTVGTGAAAGGGGAGGPNGNGNSAANTSAGTSTAGGSGDAGSGGAGGTQPAGGTGGNGTEYDATHGSGGGGGGRAFPGTPGGPGGNYGGGGGGTAALSGNNLAGKGQNGLIVFIYNPTSTDGADKTGSTSALSMQ